MLCRISRISAGTPEKKEEKPVVPVPIPRTRKPTADHVKFGLKEASLILPSGARASLHFDPKNTSFTIHLDKPVTESSLDDFRRGIAKHKEEIQEQLLKASKTSELEEAREVKEWIMKEIFVPQTLEEIVEIANKDGVVPFTVSGK
ncbi:hypothetical protein EMWEY_00047670 [Eimeria maxima]|uniref:Uncharacterized protein n=1 Tax=Eimeria maxima TaxID=5804 RepID=U6M4W9_EIMMA|nr:hypothetical protein EMWEY_00047670 [Eimeria maxima]CDJ58103.1 hypothetical protein EMWEY_00047670 [Eimeria maxima]